MRVCGYNRYHGDTVGSTLGPNQTPINLLTGAYSTGIKQLELESDHHLGTYDKFVISSICLRFQNEHYIIIVRRP